tara:strand:+ start:14514 stop:15116 length:603 start_codon:yes stop_codon:yes gene_type:complete
MNFLSLFIALIFLSLPAIAAENSEPKENICREISILGIKGNMDQGSTRDILMKNGFEVRDEYTRNGKLTGRLFGEKNSPKSKQSEEKSKAILFTHRHKGSINAKITSNAAPIERSSKKSASPEWDKVYILPAIEHRIEKFCGDMGHKQYKKHGGTTCRIEPYRVVIEHIEKRNQIIDCKYRFEATLNQYNESINIHQPKK